MKKLRARAPKTPIDVPCPLALLATIATVEEVTIDSPRRAQDEGDAPDKPDYQVDCPENPRRRIGARINDSLVNDDISNPYET